MERKETHTPAPICPDIPWADLGTRPCSQLCILSSVREHPFSGRESALLSRAGLKRGAVVLDVGCGIGQDARELMRLVGTRGRVVGADYSEAMIAGLGERQKTVLRFRSLWFLKLITLAFPATQSTLREPIECSSTLRIRARHLRRWFV